MGALKIHQHLVNEKVAEKMCGICPFGAISYNGKELEITAGCRVCKLCVKNGEHGVITWEEGEDATAVAEKTKWNGIAVFAEQENGVIHPVTYELLGKAKELAAHCPQKIYAVVLGNGMGKEAEDLMYYGADEIFYYEDERLTEFFTVPYTNMLEEFIKEVKPAVMLIGATVKGRSLAPRVAARFRTGLTADCTSLSLKENTDLVQIRPAFGGNIMAQIVTPNARPQLCTVRYKVFAAARRGEKATGKLIWRKPSEKGADTKVELLEKSKKPEETDISEAEIIVAAGRGVKDKKGMKDVTELASILGAQMACTRPLIEEGLFDARRQIGLSGRTVKPKLLITVGISGSVQFVAGMKNTDCIIAVNKDKNAAIFDVAHYGFVGDLNEVIPILSKMLQGGV